MLHKSDATTALWGLSGQQVRAMTAAIKGLMAVRTNTQASGAGTVFAKVENADVLYGAIALGAWRKMTQNGTQNGTG